MTSSVGHNAALSEMKQIFIVWSKQVATNLEMRDPRRNLVEQWPYLLLRAPVGQDKSCKVKSACFKSVGTRVKREGIKQTKQNVRGLRVSNISLQTIIHKIK